MWMKRIWMILNRVYTNERMKYDRFFVELEPLKNFYTRGRISSGLS